jgi:predicted DNA-binding protein YlxM (UPF0122 family)
MKFKITVSQVIKTDLAGNDVYENVYLQVLDLDQSPVSDIVQLLNQEPEYEEEVDDEEVPEKTPQLPANFGTLEAERENTTRTGRAVSYDRDGIIADLKADVLTIAQIAEKYNVPKQTVYNVRSKIVRRDRDDDEVAEQPKRHTDPDVLWYFNDVLELLRSGYNDTQIYHEMYTKITDAQYRNALEWAKKQDA